MADDNMKQMDIDLFEIQFNNLNPRYYDSDDEINEIYGLAESIRINGLQQNLVVYRIPQSDQRDNPKLWIDERIQLTEYFEQEKKYRLTTGSRRYLALMLLYDETHDDRFRWVPCNVDDYYVENPDIPFHIVEEMRIAVTNADAKDLTPKEIIFNIRSFENYFREYKRTNKNMTGRVRQYVANKTGLSGSSIHRYKFVDDYLDESIRMLFYNGDLSLSAAYAIAKLSKDEQLVFFKQNRDQLGVANRDQINQMISDFTSPAEKKPHADDSQPQEVNESDNEEMIADDNLDDEYVEEYLDDYEDDLDDDDPLAFIDAIIRETKEDHKNIIIEDIGKCMEKLDWTQTQIKDQPLPEAKYASIKNMLNKIKNQLNEIKTEIDGEINQPEEGSNDPSKEN